MNASPGLAVLAVGGNALIRDTQHQTVPDQFAVVRETCEYIADLVESGWKLVVTHGNGPQVGFILRRSELASGELHRVPLDSCVADTQGAIGYMIQQQLSNVFHQRGVEQRVVTVVTQTLLDNTPPVSFHPIKPIGAFMDEETARRFESKLGWDIAEDSGRGWRRLVPSPTPAAIVEIDAIRTLLGAGFVVVTVGGGGIAVVRDEDDSLRGVEAVIDKDLASAVIARELDADLFLISTGVDKVSLHFNTPEQVDLDHMTLSEAKRYMEEGHFARGSMEPKVQAMINYLENGGERALITHTSKIRDALDGKTGTHFSRD